MPLNPSGQNYGSNRIKELKFGLNVLRVEFTDSQWCSPSLFYHGMLLLILPFLLCHTFYFPSLSWGSGPQPNYLKWGHTYEAPMVWRSSRSIWFHAIRVRGYHQTNLLSFLQHTVPSSRLHLHLHMLMSLVRASISFSLLFFRTL